NFKDIFFHDDINGYIVGNSGALLKSKDFIYPNNDIYTASLSSGGFQGMDIDDNLNGQLDPADMDINTIHFSSRTKGFVAGKYNGAGTTPKGYNRTIEDGAGLISQRFWYDQIGRITLSQNTKQFNKNSYSYTKYDELARTIEGGEKRENSSGTRFTDIFGDYVQGYYNPNVLADNNLTAFLNNSTGQRTEVSQTFYDEIPSSIASNLPNNFEATNARKRVATTTYHDVYSSTNAYANATHVAYDIHGNAIEVLQDYPKVNITTQRFKKLTYDFDIVSHNVNGIQYQEDQLDAFYHKYSYDEDNRLTQVQTSSDKLHYDQDAHYYYHMHNTVARLELGENKVQGIDYTYHLKNWVKGANSNTLDASRDPGQDAMANANNNNQLFAKDAFGYTLNYYPGDYTPIHHKQKWDVIPNRFQADLTNSNLVSQTKPLFTGNMSSIITTIRDSATMDPLPNGFVYEYDELNRLSLANAWQNLDLTSNSWGSNSTDLKIYENKFRYDGNGNIEYQSRRNSNGQMIDQVSYHYHVDDPQAQSPKKLQNKLFYLTDAIAPNLFDDDLDDQIDFIDPNLPILEGSNYKYSEIGELVKDSIEGISEIIWHTNGRIKEIKRVAGSAKKNLKFDYNSNGNRIAKHVYTSSGTWLYSFYYVTELSGKVLAVYKKGISKKPVQIGGNSGKTSTFQVTERNIYGSKRLGKYAEPVTLFGAIKDAVGNAQSISILKPSGSSIPRPSKGNKRAPAYHNIGDRHYELNNHLNNVITVVSDKKLPKDNGSGNVDHYMPDILSATDYSAFGVRLDERNYVIKNYRYSFQAQEHDDEVKGKGNAINYNARLHDPRVGRFFSLDPRTADYPWNSPYAFSENRVTDGIELEGREHLTYIVNWYEGQDEPEIYMHHHDDMQWNSYDRKRGPGVLYVTNHWDVDERGLKTFNEEKSVTLFHARDDWLIEYGLYYGATALYKLNKDGTLSETYDYSLPPVDAVDYGAWLHDRAYDAVDAVGAGGLVVDWATTPADLAAVEAWQAVIDRGVGARDPYNGQDITEDQVTAAKRGVKGFGAIAGRKKEKMSVFVWQEGIEGYRSIHNVFDAAAVREHNYQLFLDFYFEKDVSGFYVKKPGYWEEDENGDPIPGGWPLRMEQLEENGVINNDDDGGGP
ncbi:MAG: hypothetical protein MRY83_05960, partial [Flavobacteriales bacterium]|nr:hypothetical protein [Flavobacteriales bacterium]